MKKPYLLVEPFNQSAKIDFLGKHGFTVNLSLENGELHVCILGAEYPNAILLDQCIEIPECENE